jgi:hypothetical protein
MRKIVTAVSAAALSLSMLASAGPALAVVGYDSAYAGESAFVFISPGQTQNFQVFFVNTGTTTWSRGTGTQVDLAACLADKVTCNAQDASEASWNSGWLSATRYASTVQTTTAPGALATFSYNVTAPVGAAAGTYRFNGDLVLSTTGERIHPEGYFQDATIGGPDTGAATLTSISPSSGTSAGGTPVTLTGTGIQCTPAFPSVSFGGTNAVVTSCGATSVGVTSPAHAPGAVTVTLTNSGQAASNGLTFTYVDEADPVFTSLAVSGEFATVTFSEPVCRVGAFAATDWTVNNVSAAAINTVQSDSIPTCDAEFDNGVTSAVLDLTTAMPNGAFVEATLNTRGTATTDSDNEAIRDQAGNFIDAPQSRQATATAPETTAPTITSASGAVGSTTITINFSEPVRCGAGLAADDFTLTDNNTATVDPTITGFGANPCGTSPTTADTSFSVTTSSALPADRTYTLTITPESGDIEDVVGNDLANPSSVTFTTGAGDFTPPTIVDARMVNNLVTTDFTEAGDSFSATFSEVMETTTTGDSLQIQDLDGTVFTLSCGGNVSCTWNTAGTTVTVTVTTTITPPVVGAPGAGNTPGMQIPFDITTLNGFMDLQGNVPNVGNSSDRRVDFE